MIRTEVDKIMRKMDFHHLRPKDKVFIMVLIVKNQKQSGHTIGKGLSRTIELIIRTTRNILVQKWIRNLTSIKKFNGTEHIKIYLNSRLRNKITLEKQRTRSTKMTLCHIQKRDKISMIRSLKR